MQKNTFMIAMIMMTRNNLLLLLILTIVSSCSLSPGVYLKEDYVKNNEEFVYLDSEKKISIPVKPIDLELVKNLKSIRTNEPYEIGIGDALAITIWGLPEIFPMNNVNQDSNQRVVNTDGTIFFPYVGTLSVIGKTQVEVREELTKKLAKLFTEPQLDVSIKYNSQKIFLLGEVTVPTKINLTETPLSLSDAIGEAKGLRTDTSAADEIYIIRSNKTTNFPEIFKADLSNPSGILIANDFYLEPYDIVYVNAKGTSRWNRVISQFFPFSSFLNSVDRLISDD